MKEGEECCKMMKQKKMFPESGTVRKIQVCIGNAF